MNAVRNQKGSTLVWAMTIIMVMMVLIVGMLTISQQYHARSLQNYKIRQSQVTAQAAGDLLAEMIAENLNGAEEFLVPMVYDGSARATVKVENMKFGSKMGKVNATITRTAADKLTIKVHAEYQEVDFDLKIKMVVADSDEGGQAWTQVYYQGGSEAKE